MPQTRSLYSLAGRVGGLTRAAQYDGREMTARARQRFRESFADGHACRVCPLVTVPTDLLPLERTRRAEALRRAHYARIAMASARVRSKKKAASSTKADGLEEGDATAHPTEPQHNRKGQPPMRFEWRPCPNHRWLGVSVLIVGDSQPVCFLEDGTAHPVAREQLGAAA